MVDRYVADDEVGSYFRAADVVVLPYVSATQSAVVLTAYSFGRPVIVTRVGGLPDVVDDGVTGFVVPARAPEELARAMTRFFDENAGERMTRRDSRARRAVFVEPVRRCRAGSGRAAVGPPSVRFTPPGACGIIHRPPLFLCPRSRPEMQERALRRP